MPSAERLNIIGELHPLLTPSLIEAVQDARVATYPVQGDPRTPPGSIPKYIDCREKLGELAAVQLSMLNPYDVHEHCEGAGRLALVRKTSPHGMYEMTVMATEGYDGKPIDNLFGFEPTIRRSFYNAGFSFSQYSESNGLYPVLSFTYDPYTNDRKAAQSVKIFHLQLTARSQDELNQINAHIIKLHESGNSIQRRQFIDESGVVLSYVLGDYFRANPLLNLIPVLPFTTDACSNIRFDVGKDWDSVMTSEFDNDLAMIHKTINTLYKEFASLSLVGNIGSWRRPKLLKENAQRYIDSLQWIQESTKEMLKFYIAGLNTRHLENVVKLQSLNLTSHIYPLSGISYGAALSRCKSGNIMLSISPKVFAETGGTGLQYLDPINAHVRMGRGCGKYTSDELKEKIKFEKSCVKSIVKSMSSPSRK